MVEDKKTDLLKPLADILKRIKDAEQRKLVKNYINVVSSIDNVKDFVETISDKYVEDIDEVLRGKLESIIQNIEAKILEINSDFLEWLELILERGTLGKGELSSYFVDTIKGIFKDLTVVKNALTRWQKTVEQKGEEIVKDKTALDKGISWLQIRTSGPLIRINKKNQNLSRVLNKIREEQVTTETVDYLRKTFKIKSLA